MRLFKFLFGNLERKTTAKHKLAATVHNANEPLTGDNLIKWHFDELTKTLITLSSSVDRQIEIMGFGNANSEMVEDFVWHYIDTKDELVSHLLLTEQQTTMLDSITNLINKHSGKPEDDFWDREQLKSHADWFAIRQIAKEILILLGKDNLELRVVTTNEYDKTGEGKKLIIQRQTIDLITNESLKQTDKQ